MSKIKHSIRGGNIRLSVTNFKSKDDNQGILNYIELLGYIEKLEEVFDLNRKEATEESRTKSKGSTTEVILIPFTQKEPKKPFDTKELFEEWRTPIRLACPFCGRNNYDYKSCDTVIKY